jgi:hypothetical protein
MSDSPEPPAPTPEELELQRLQAEQLRQQNEALEQARREQNLLQPILLQELGFDVEVDPETGEIIAITERALTEEEQAQKQIEIELQQRSLAALRGELPVDPALIDDLADRRSTLEAQLAQDFGSLSAARTSTPGIERLREFDEFEAQVLDQARRGDLTLATNLSLQARGANVNESLAGANVLGLGVGGVPGAQPVSFMELANNLQQERQQNFAFEQQRFQNQRAGTIGAVSGGASIGGTIGAAFGGFGAPIGAAIGAGFGALSASAF